MLSAYNGIEVLEIFAQRSIELVILDIMLPNMNGLQVLSEIRRTSDIPVLMLTVLSNEETQITSFDSFHGKGAITIFLDC